MNKKQKEAKLRKKIERIRRRFTAAGLISYGSDHTGCELWWHSRVAKAYSHNKLTAESGAIFAGILEKTGNVGTATTFTVISNTFVPASSVKEVIALMVANLLEINV